LRMLAGLAQIPLRVDMVYWPTPGARLCRREALPLRSSAPYQSGAAAGVGTSIAMQSRRRAPFIGEARRHVPSRRRPETIWREKETRAYAGR
jgi:hypothetical protein